MELKNNHRIHPFTYCSIISVGEQLHTDTSGHVSRWVGVALVTLAVEGAICVLAVAVVPTDGFIDALINICVHREVSETLIFTVSACTIDTQAASVNTALLLQNKHHYHSDLTITTEITSIITC